MMYDIVAMGELLIDFTPAGESSSGNILFERNPGGAPANVLAVLAKLGCKTAFLGKVGRDQFGQFLKTVLYEANIETRGLIDTDACNTTLAFVHLNPDGDRTFSFYRNPGADVLLRTDEIDYDLIEQAKVFHFGSLSMTQEPVRSATFSALEHAKRHGRLISYDPNLRIPLWADLDTAKTFMTQGMEYADIVKVSEEELLFLTGISEMEDGTAHLCNRYGTQLILVTRGAKGCFYRLNGQVGARAGYSVQAIDTTGAGDAFLGAALFQILDSGTTLARLTTQQMDEFVDFANAMGALTTTKKGAIPAIPTLDAVEALRSSQV